MEVPIPQFPAKHNKKKQVKKREGERGREEREEGGVGREVKSRGERRGVTVFLGYESERGKEGESESGSTRGGEEEEKHGNTRTSKTSADSLAR